MFWRGYIFWWSNNEKCHFTHKKRIWATKRAPSEFFAWFSLKKRDLCKVYLQRKFESSLYLKRSSIFEVQYHYRSPFFWMNLSKFNFSAYGYNSIFLRRRKPRRKNIRWSFHSWKYSEFKEQFNKKNSRLKISFS